MSKRKSGFMNAVMIAQEQALRKAGLISRMQTLDKVVITLGQMGMTPEGLAQFADEYAKVEIDYCQEVIDDSKDDKDIEYAKARIDRAIKQYVQEDRFVPYDERYRI